MEFTFALIKSTSLLLLSMENESLLQIDFTLFAFVNISCDGATTDLLNGSGDKNR